MYDDRVRDLQRKHNAQQPSDSIAQGHLAEIRRRSVAPYDEERRNQAESCDDQEAKEPLLPWNSSAIEKAGEPYQCSVQESGEEEA
jgi:hypothetical protein